MDARRLRLGLTIPVVVSTALLALLLGGAGSSHGAGAHAQRGYGDVFYVSMLKRPNAPLATRNVLRLFTRNARDNAVWAARGNNQARGAYHGRNNGFEEWRVRRRASGDARRLVRGLARSLRRKGRVRFRSWTIDLDFPKPSLVFTCKLTGFNNLGSCSAF